jgi:prophage tail gpP-like protein
MPDVPGSDVRIRVGSEELTDWTAYQIESNLLQDSDAFTITLANPGGKLKDKVRIHDTVQVLVDSVVQLTGYIDEIHGSGSSGSPELTITGRDRFGQLVDTMPAPQSIAGKDLRQIAIDLSAPFVTIWIHDNSDNRRKLLQTKRKLARLKRHQKFLKTQEMRIEVDSTGQTFYRIGPDQVKIKTTKGRIDKATAYLNKIKKDLFPRVKIEAGESVMEVLVRLAAKSGFLVWQAANGDGIIARPDYLQDAMYDLRLYSRDDVDYQRNNVIEYDVRRDGRDRYRSYRAMGYSANTKNTSGTGSRHDVSLTDDEVTLAARQYTVALDNSSKRKEVSEQLQRERDRREFESEIATYTVNGHRQNGIIWQVDARCSVDDRINNITGKLYIVRRQFVGDDEGQRTEIELRRSGVYLP